MYISNVEIKGYKSINYDGVSFSLGQIAAFIGKNSAGKSNLLEALDHFFNNTPMFPDDFYRKETDKPIEITVSFCLDDDDTSFDLVLHANKRMITLRRTFDCGQKPQTFMVGSWKYTADDSFNPLITPSAAVLKKTLTSENVQAFLISNFPCRTVDTPTQYVELLKEYWQDHFESMPKEWDPTLKQPLKALPAALPAYYYLPVRQRRPSNPRWNRRRSQLQHQAKNLCPRKRSSLLRLHLKNRHRNLLQSRHPNLQ